jgi:KEOPS complex subunit Cgi121
VTIKRETAGLDEVYAKKHDGTICLPFSYEGSPYEVRSAISTIEDRAAFLHTLRTLAEAHDAHIICFNADMLAGIQHAHTAICHAVRSYNAGTMVSNTLEMEALLYAAGSRQCSLAAPFGVHSGENHLYICCYPASDRVWEALAPVIHIVEDSWSCIDSKKRAYLIDLFAITQDELATTIGNNIVDLVLERIALLEVYR